MEGFFWLRFCSHHSFHLGNLSHCNAPDGAWLLGLWSIASPSPRLSWIVPSQKQPGFPNNGGTGALLLQPSQLLSQPRMLLCGLRKLTAESQPPTLTLPSTHAHGLHAPMLPGTCVRVSACGKHSSGALEQGGGGNQGRKSRERRREREKEKVRKRKEKEGKRR